MDGTQFNTIAKLFASRRFSRRMALCLSGAGLATTAFAGAGRPAGAQSISATPGVGTGVPTSETPFPAEIQLALTNIVATSLAQTATPAALVGIWYPGKGTWLHAAGIGDLTTALPIHVDDHWRIASNTKTFTATVVLQLVDEGKLSVDDKLEQFVPGIPNGREITLRQVLGMRAGIFDYVADKTFAANYDRDPLLPFTPDQGIEIIKRHPPDFAPGATMHYSNSNYLLLGMIIEQVTGQSVGDAITKRIIQPLGLSQTSYPTTPEMPAPYAHGYEAVAVGDRLRDVTRSNPAVPGAAGAMISTLADLRIWVKALADGALLSPAVQRERLTWSRIPGAALDLRYGLGILDVNGLIGHNGGIAGYSSWMVHAPEENATVIMVTTRASEEGGSADPIFIEIVRLLFPHRFPPSPATPVATPVS